MDVVFENRVDAAISRFLGCVGAVPVAFIGTFEFANGFRAYRQREDVDAIALALIECHTEFYSNNLTGDNVRRWMESVFAEFDTVVDVVGRSNLAVDTSRAEMVRAFGVVKDFSDIDYSNLFHFTVQCVIDFERYKRAWGAGQSISVPDELENLYDPNEGLIDVSGLHMTVEAFTDLKSGWTVIPAYKMLNYGLTKKFTGLFARGIPSQWKVWVAPQRIVRQEDAPRQIMMQCERLWGEKFSEKAFKRLYSKSYGCFQYCADDPLARISRLPLYQLQYKIESKDSEGLSSAVIEELINVDDKKNISPTSFVYGTADKHFVCHRMVHLMYDVEASQFVHLDLSNLYYDKKAYRVRLGQQLGRDTPKATRKFKVFKIDGPMSFDVVTDLIGVSLEGMHNPEVGRLLRGE